MRATLIAVLLAASACAEAQPNEQASTSTNEAAYLAVFNRPGPAWEERSDARDALIAHTELYRGYAARGDILVGGRFEGEPVLGLSVFSSGIDEDAVREAFESDPAVEAGIIAIEFRQWSVQMGGLDD